MIPAAQASRGAARPSRSAAREFSGDRPRIARAASLALVIVLATLSAGCFSVTGKLSGFRQERKILERCGLKVDSGFGMSFGSMTLGLAAKAADTSEEAAVIRAIDGIEIAILENASPGVKVGREAALEIGRQRGLTQVLHARDAGSEVLVYAEEKNERIGSLLVVVLDEEQVVLARVKGDLEEVVQAAFASRSLRRGPTAVMAGLHLTTD